MQNITVGDSILSYLGTSLLALALLATINQIARPKSETFSIRIITMILQVSPFLLIVFSFILEATTLDLVSRYAGFGSNLPFFYRISAVWSSRSGPLLMWIAILAIINIYIHLDKNTGTLEFRFMNTWIAILILISLLLDPFAPATSNISGELNPLLQTNLMVIHPPIVFMFYSLCLATSSIAMAGIIRNDDAEKIHYNQIFWARASFTVGTIGIGLGGLWAYTVLDWGGYWAWDPVETGSLLPWIALLIIIHARSKPNSNSAFSISPALALITGALTLHSTLVTRANGVWASVHAFVGDGKGSLPQDPYLRILDVIDFSAVGIEILSYLVLICILSVSTLIYLIRNQKRELESKMKTSLLQENKFFSAMLLISFLAIGFWIGSVAVLCLGTSIMLLLINSDSEKPNTAWVTAGVFLMLFSSWSSIAEITQAIVGLIPFMLTWLISDVEDDFSHFNRIITDITTRINFAKLIPWYGGMIFLLLTWLLLTVEIDGPSLEAHEFYGAPIIGFLALGITIYSWGRSIENKTQIIILSTTLLVSLIFPFFSDLIHLPGDSDLVITSGITRGALVLFLLPWFLLSLIPTFLRLKNTTKLLYGKFKNDGIRSNRSSKITKLFGSHISHLGIILLLIGHLFTTTLVDRSDPSHLVDLKKDETVEFNNLELKFKNVEIVSSNDESYAYSIGDGYIGIIVEVYENGILKDEVMPGMLSFYSPSGSVIARSEVDRMVGLTGDTIVILDVFQSNDLLSAMITGTTDEVEEVRITVHQLPGSHLVWLGWIMLILGGFFTLITKEKNLPLDD